MTTEQYSRRYYSVTPALSRGPVPLALKGALCDAKALRPWMPDRVRHNDGAIFKTLLLRHPGLEPGPSTTSPKTGTDFRRDLWPGMAAGGFKLAPRPNSRCYN